MRQETRGWESGGQDWARSSTASVSVVFIYQKTTLGQNRVSLPQWYGHFSPGNSVLLGGACPVCLPV